MKYVKSEKYCTPELMAMMMGRTPSNSKRNCCGDA